MSSGSSGTRAGPSFAEGLFLALLTLIVCRYALHHYGPVRCYWNPKRKEDYHGFVLDKGQLGWENANFTQGAPSWGKRALIDHTPVSDATRGCCGGRGTYAAHGIPPPW